jgi:hypothetical protein
MGTTPEATTGTTDNRTRRGRGDHDAKKQRGGTNQGQLHKQGTAPKWQGAPPYTTTATMR